MVRLDGAIFIDLAVVVQGSEQLVALHPRLNLVADLVQNQAQRVDVLLHINLEVLVLRGLSSFAVVSADFGSHVSLCARH